MKSRASIDALIESCKIGDDCLRHIPKKFRVSCDDCSLIGPSAHDPLKDSGCPSVDSIFFKCCSSRVECVQLISWASIRVFQLIYQTACIILAKK